MITYTTPLWLHVRQEAALAFLRTKNLTKFERNQIEESKDSKTLNRSKFNFAAYLEPNESQKYGATGNESNQLTMINTTGS